MLCSILGLLLLPLVLAEQKCQEHPNYQTKAYTYIICSGTSATNLNSSRMFCQAYANGTDVVTFPNQEEYEFMASKVNETMDNSFMYIPGFFQKADASDRFDPSTGEYYWTSDLDTVITVTSPTYWEPFREFITNFDLVLSTYAMTATFLLDANGNWFLGESLGGGPPRTPFNGDVVCMKSGIPPKPKNPTSSTSTDDEFQYWIVITVAASVIVLGLIIAAVAFCFFRKTKHKHNQGQRFKQVPTAEIHDNGKPVPLQISV